LVITGQESTPTEITPNGIVLICHDLKTIHEEADIVNVARAVYATKKRDHVVVVADATDVYILLLYHYQAKALSDPHDTKADTNWESFN